MASPSSSSPPISPSLRVSGSQANPPPDIDALVDTDAQDEPIAGLIYDLHNTPLIGSNQSVPITSDARGSWSQSMSTIHDSSLMADALTTDSQDILSRTVQLDAAQQAIEKVEDIDNLLDESSALKEYAQEMAEMLHRHPALMMHLPQYHQQIFGTPTREALKDARQALQKVIEENHDLQRTSAEKIEENNDLRRNLAEAQQELQELKDQPFISSDAELQTISSRIGKERAALRANLSLFMSSDAAIEWDKMENSLSAAVSLSREWSDTDLVLTRGWSSRFEGLSKPLTNTIEVSTREVGAAILASLYTADFTVSMGHLHTLAVKLELSSLENLPLPLAILQTFLKRKRDAIVLDSQQISIARSLIMLRGIELFCDYIRRAFHLADVDRLFEDIQPFLARALNESILVRAMNLYVKERLWGGSNPSLIDKIVAEAAQISLVRDNRTMFMDGDNFIAVVDSCVHVTRPDQVHMGVSGKHGWQIRLSQDDGTTWASSYFAFGPESITTLHRCFHLLMKRLSDGNQPVAISDATRLLQDC